MSSRRGGDERIESALFGLRPERRPDEGRDGLLDVERPVKLGLSSGLVGAAQFASCSVREMGSRGGRERERERELM